MKRYLNIMVIYQVCISLILINQSCTEKERPSIPVLRTSDVTDVTRTSASSGGNVTGDGGASISVKGICWDISENPTTANEITIQKGDTGKFTSKLTSLVPGTTYYVRAYASNSAGIAYGNNVSFTTNSIQKATITTSVVTSLTTSTATCGGDIPDNGGSPVTEKGVCWGESQNPTIKDSKTTDGSGTGSFVSYLTGLSADTKYYVRAYAVNSAGTEYGNEVFFTTDPILKSTVSTTMVSSVTCNSAVSGGEITSDGGGVISARGVCWDTSTDPTIENNKTSDGSGKGIFVSYLTNLQPATMYYVRAYATNEAGTDYGENQAFTIYCCIPDLITPTDNAILDNGCFDQSDLITWYFDWADCIGASKYNLYVKNVNAPNPVLDVETSYSEYLHSAISYIIEGNFYDWKWKVRSFKDGNWGEWSEERTFSVEPLNTDCNNFCTDIEGNVYKTVKIGTQIWLKENLKTTKFNDGTNIPLVTDDTEWSGLTSTGYCWYNNNVAYKNEYGALYNFYAVTTGKLCPSGWHVPSDDEWTLLIDFLGGEEVAGGKLKEAGLSHWHSPNYNATNESGFSGLPGGYRLTVFYSGILGDANVQGLWWSTTKFFNSTSYWWFGLGSSRSSVYRAGMPCWAGLSVRCLQNTK